MSLSNLVDLARVLPVLLALLTSCTVQSGCNAPSALPREFGIIAQQVGTAVTDQAVFQEIVAKLDAHVNNPGIRTSAGVEYYAEAKLVGVDGSVSLDGEGVGNGQGLSAEARSAIIRMTDDEWAAVLQEVVRRRAASQPSTMTTVK